MSQLKVLLNKGNNASPRYIPVALNLGVTETEDKFYPCIKEFSSKTYIAWAETNSNSLDDMNIRVALYNGASLNTFTQVDAGGINSTTPRKIQGCYLQVFNSKLYVIFTEIDISSNKQIHVFVYNGNDISPSWTKVSGSGIEISTTSTSIDNVQLLTFNSKLYAIWSEGTTSIPTLVKMKVYNGNDGSPSWTLVSNDSLNYGGTTNYISTAVANGKLYISWSELNINTNFYTYIVVYNGNDGAPTYARIDDGDPTTGFAINLLKFYTKPGLFSRNNGSTDFLYVAVSETTDSSDPSLFDLIVAKYNGEDFSPSWLQDNNDTPLDNFATGNYLPLINNVVIKNQWPYFVFNEKNGSKNNLRLSTADSLGSSLPDPTDDTEFVDRTSPFFGDPANEIEAMYSTAGNFILYSKYNVIGPARTVQALLYDLSGGATANISPVGGLQTDTTVIPSMLSPIEHASKLYSFFAESNADPTVIINAKVWNGNSVTPVWTSVLGNLNSSYISQYISAMRPVEFNSNLYVFLSDYAFGSYNLKLLKYNDNDVSPSWSDILENINTDSVSPINNIKTIVYKSKLYIILERQNSGNTKSYFEILVYNGNDEAPAFTQIYSNETTAQFNYGLNVFVNEFNVDSGDEKLYISYVNNTSGTITSRIITYNGNDLNPLFINVYHSGNFSNSASSIDMAKLLDYKVYGINYLASGIQIKFYNDWDFTPDWFIPTNASLDVNVSPNTILYAGKTVRSYNGGGSLSSILLFYILDDYSIHVNEIRIFTP